jgi:hypothetical protein
MPLPVDVAADDYSRHNGCPDSLESRRRALGAGASCPRVVDQQDALTVQAPHGTVTPAIEGTRLCPPSGSSQKAFVPIPRLGHFADDTTQWVVAITLSVT